MMMVVVYIIQTKTKKQLYQTDILPLFFALLSVSLHQASKYYRCIPFADVHQKERVRSDCRKKVYPFPPKQDTQIRNLKQNGVLKRNLHKFKENWCTKRPVHSKNQRQHTSPHICAVKSVVAVAQFPIRTTLANYSVVFLHLHTQQKTLQKRWF